PPSAPPSFPTRRSSDLKFGGNALSWSLDTCGPLTRGVRDSALVLEAIAGHDPRDPSTSRRPTEPYTTALEGAARGLRVGVPREEDRKSTRLNSSHSQIS